ncbi:MAG TPA: hypothetical protein PKW80_07100 [Bacteroidales bacterium]|nr:hypothetical protein [Bacteroidales bacterium]
MTRQLFLIFFLAAVLISASGEQSYSIGGQSAKKPVQQFINFVQPASVATWPTGKPKKSQAKKNPGRKVGWDGKQKSSRQASTKSRGAYRKSGPAKNAGTFSYSNVSVKSRGNWKNTKTIAGSKNAGIQPKKNWQEAGPSNVKNVKNTKKER